MPTIRPIAAALAAACCLLLLLGASPARACKCAPHSVPEALSEAEAVFEGRVISIEDEANPAQPGVLRKRVTLNIVRVWKDLEDVETVTVTTNAESAACGYPFERNQSYLVYASRTDDALSVHSCSRTRPMADASEDLAQLGGGVTPVHVAPAQPGADAGPKGAPNAADTAHKPAKTRGCSVVTAAPARDELGLSLLAALGLLVQRRSAAARRKLTRS